MRKKKTKLPENVPDIFANLLFLRIPGGGTLKTRRHEILSAITEPLVEGLTPSKEEITDAYMESLNEKQ